MTNMGGDSKGLKTRVSSIDVISGHWEVSVGKG